MYLLSATGFSNFPKISWLLGILQALVHHEAHVATTSSAVTGWPSDHRAFGLMPEAVRQLVRRDLPVCGERWDVVERRRMERQAATRRPSAAIM